MLLEWSILIDSHPHVFKLVCLLMFFSTLGCAIIPLISIYYKHVILTQIDKNWIFLSLSLATLLICRLPGILLNVELNPDESLMLAEAITFKSKWIFWKFVDGSTHGPLNVLPLIIPSLFGFDIDYVSGRFVSIGLIGLSLLLFYRTTAIFFGYKVARLSYLVPFAFFSLTEYFDFIHFSSEHVPIFLLSIAIYLFSELWKNQKCLNSSLFVLGIVLGCIPFSKLQAVPIALFISLSTFYLLILRERTILTILYFTISGLLVPCIVLFTIYSFGVWNEFWNSYVLDNLNYSKGGSTLLFTLKGYVYNLIFYHDDATSYLGSGCRHFSPAFAILPVLLGLVILLKLISKWYRFYNHMKVILFFGFLFLVSLFSVAKAGRLVSHYLLFLVFPLSLITSLIYSELFHSINQILKWKRSATFTYFKLVFSLSVSIIVLYFSILHKTTFLNNLSFQNYLHSYVGNLYPTNNAEPSYITQQLLEHTEPNDHIVVWGGWRDIMCNLKH